MKLIDLLTIFQSDLYSLGIILLELLIPFQTDMERVETIQNARKGRIPESISPKFLHLLQRYDTPNSHSTFLQ